MNNNTTSKPLGRYAARYSESSRSKDSEAQRWNSWYGYTNVNTPKHRAGVR